jgi:hypothetical protein
VDETNGAPAPEYGLKEAAPAVELAAPALPPDFWERLPDGLYANVLSVHCTRDGRSVYVPPCCTHTEAEALDLENLRPQ